MIRIPATDGTLTAYQPSSKARSTTPDNTPFTSRSVLAPAHVVGDPLAANEPFGPPLGPPPPQSLDWDATLAFRRHLWAHGFTVAEALDTAHRGAGLDWPTAAELIRRSGAEARAVGGKLAVGVWTDQLDPFSPHSLDDAVKAYEEQLEVVEEAGATAIIQASTALAQAARTPEEYAGVYDRLLGQTTRPAILHWLLPEWVPGHTGYWGHAGHEESTQAFIDLVTTHQDRIDGVKVAPLGPEHERVLRRRLPDGVRFYTGDYDTYTDLIAGDEHGHSDALSPVFDLIAPVAAEAFRSLDAGDAADFRTRLDSTLDLARHVFEGPGRSTLFFKTGLVFLAWLGGHADHFRMVWAEQGARSVPHLAQAYRLADELGLFPDPDLAAYRIRQYLDVSGVAQ
ncbi:DUF993 family protein [Streptomyces agglomeratus]|uniref:DUF993 family protein n=1 Tax=Streptomyces agglomeratus TaxID=285458 RepID=UPI000854B584|nr:DUF993 family protein [Streptomyces agglomeratus]OEJ36242.1 dihydrodipicolinate synthase family protein [Streptomyces agglomeratus]